MSKDSVMVLIHYRTQPGREEVGVRELASLIATVTAEESACAGITMFQDVDDPARILLYERWTSRAAYTGPHMQTAHIQAFIKKAPSFMEGPPGITFWQLTHEATATGEGPHTR
jgi:quinol monooxygenase YgiN